MPAVITPALNETTSPYLFDGTVTIGGANASYALTQVAPGNIGLKAWNFPTYLATGTSTFSLAGTVYLALVHLNLGQTYSNIYTRLVANAGTATAGSCFAGIYNAAGTLVATTADISTVLGAAAGTTGYLTFPLATALTPTASAPFYVGMFFNASGTASFPVFQGLVGQTAANSITAWAGTVVGPVAAAPFPWAAIATTSGTAMPASFALGSAGTTNAQTFWVALA